MSSSSSNDDGQRGSAQIQDRARLWGLIKDIRFAMFTTRHANGHLHSRPMTTQNSRLDEDERLWFFMSRSHEAVGELQRSPVVNVAYADLDADRYVSIAGEASVVDDPAKKHALWSRMSKAWFPKGADDPDLALVCVRIIHADTWQVTDSKITQVAKMAKAALTGERPHGLGEHTRIDLRDGTGAGTAGP